jgi:hypothetical protein
MITRTRETKEDGSFVETLTEEQSSAEVSVNSKGDIVFTLKVYKDNAVDYLNTSKDFLKAIAEVKAEAIELGLAPAKPTK